MTFMDDTGLSMAAPDIPGCEGPWLGPGGPPLAQTAWTGLENTTHLVGVVGVGFWQGRLLALDLMYDNPEC